VGDPDTLWNSAPYSSPICRGRQTLWPVLPQSLKGSISERLAAPMLLNRKPRRPDSERRATWTCQRHGSVPVASQDAHNDNPLRAPSQSHEPSRQTRPVHPTACPLLPIPRLQSAIFATPFVNPLPEGKPRLLASACVVWILRQQASMITSVCGSPNDRPEGPQVAVASQLSSRSRFELQRRLNREPREKPAEPG